MISRSHIVRALARYEFAATTRPDGCARCCVVDAARGARQRRAAAGRARRRRVGGREGRRLRARRRRRRPGGARGGRDRPRRRDARRGARAARRAAGGADHGRCRRSRRARSAARPGSTSSARRRARRARCAAVPDVRIHVKADTGMGRWGLDAGRGARGRRRSPAHGLAGLLLAPGHLRGARHDVRRRADRARSARSPSRFPPCPRHLANSGGALYLPAARFDAGALRHRAVRHLARATRTRRPTASRRC